MKVKVRVIVIGVIILSFIYLQWGRNIEVCNTQVENSNDYCKQKIMVIANRVWISDKEKFGYDMIQKCRDNSFDKIRFSYDLEQPNELIIQVYTNRLGYRMGEPNFTVYFKNKEKNGQYDIIDNPEEFEMIVE